MEKEEKTTTNEKHHVVTTNKTRIVLNRKRKWAKYVDKVIIALTTYDTFYKVN